MCRVERPGSAICCWLTLIVSNEKCTLPGSAPALWNVDLWQLSWSRSSCIPHAKMPSDNTVLQNAYRQRRTGGTGACGSVWVGMHLLILLHLAGLCFPINNKVTLGQMTSVLPLSSQIPLSITLSPTKSPKVLLRFWRSVKSLRHLKPPNSIAPLAAQLHPVFFQRSPVTFGVTVATKAMFLPQHGMGHAWRSTYNSFSPDFNSTFTFSECKRLCFILSNFSLFVCMCVYLCACVHVCVHAHMHMHRWRSEDCCNSHSRISCHVVPGSKSGPSAGAFTCWAIAIAQFYLKPSDHRDFVLEFVYVCLHLFVHLLVKGRALKLFLSFPSWQIYADSNILVEGEAGFQWEWRVKISH